MLILVVTIICTVFIWITILTTRRKRQREKWSAIAEAKGAAGESQVASLLSRLGPKYRVINNLLVQSNGRSVQIDHVVVSIYGIFVIETKNYSGYLEGDAESRYLTYHGKRDYYSIYNPLFQNASHCHAISKLIDCPDVPIVSIVTVSDECGINVDSDAIVPFSNLCREIRSYRGRVMSKSDMKILTKYIHKNNIDSPYDRLKHVSSIKEQLGYS